MVEGGRATGVETSAGGTYAADAVLVACGAATPAVVEPLGVQIPNGSPVSMLVVTKQVQHDVAAVMNTPRAALRPNPGGTFALDHDWYEEHITEHADGSFSIPDEVVQELADEASKLIEGNPELKPASWKMGYKPIPGDGEPVLGELGQVPGCFVAFTHSGATPLVAWATMRAMGFAPSCWALAALVTTRAAAPSLVLGAFPAVTVPSFLKAGFSLRNVSALVSSRGPSSVSKMCMGSRSALPMARSRPSRR